MCNPYVDVVRVHQRLLAGALTVAALSSGANAAVAQAGNEPNVVRTQARVVGDDEALTDALYRYSRPAERSTDARRATTLPFTGVPVGDALLVGATLAGAGALLAVRRESRRPRAV